MAHALPLEPSPTAVLHLRDGSTQLRPALRAETSWPDTLGFVEATGPGGSSATNGHPLARPPRVVHRTFDFRGVDAEGRAHYHER